MAQPIDYLGMMQRPNIGESLLGGIKTGLGIRQAQEEQAAREQARQQQEQYKSDLQQYLDNPSAAGASAMIAKYPDQAKAFKQSFDLFNQGQKDSLFRAGTQAYSAIQSGNVDAALKVFDEQIEAMKNSGQDTSDFESLRDQVKQNPQAANSAIGLSLASIDPDKWSKIATEQRAAEQAPFELSEKQSKAAKSAVDAKFAESKAVQDLQKGGWEIQKLANDIEVQNLNKKIAVMDASIKREENERKREEIQLKRDEAAAKRDQAVRTTASAVESSRSVIDNSLGTINSILDNPALPDVLGAVEGAEFYPTTLAGLASSAVGGASADQRQNALANIETLKSQTFMTQLQQLKEASATGASGLGGVTEKEVDLLINGVQSLNTKQGEKQFKKNLEKMQKLLLEGRSRLAEKYGVPDTEPNIPEEEPEVATAPRPAPAPAQNAPSVGQVVDGYRFIGGDPSKPGSWRKQ